MPRPPYGRPKITPSRWHDHAARLLTERCPHDAQAKPAGSARRYKHDCIQCIGAEMERVAAAACE